MELGLVIAYLYTFHVHSLSLPEKGLRQLKDLGVQLDEELEELAVQQFMVEYTFEQALQERSLTRSQLSSSEADALWHEVFQLWALPSLDPKTPLPHTTGATVDVSLFDLETQETVWMGSPIDELSERSQPDFVYSVITDSQRPEPERKQAALAHHDR